MRISDWSSDVCSSDLLKRMPFTELKIDREFVAGAPQDPAARAMLSSSISLAKELGLTTVADGVETKGAWCLVARGGVDAVQGYFVARPMPATEMEGWLRPPSSSVG